MLGITFQGLGVRTYTLVVLYGKEGSESFEQPEGLFEGRQRMEP